MVHLAYPRYKTRYNFSIQFSSIYKWKIVACVSVVMVARIYLRGEFLSTFINTDCTHDSNGRDETK